MAHKLVVFCGVLGRHRAGMQHPPMAAYPLDHFSAGQLAELRRDPVFHLAIGEIATPETLDGLVGQAFAREHAASGQSSVASGQDAKEGGRSSPTGHRPPTTAKTGA